MGTMNRPLMPIKLRKMFVLSAHALPGGTIYVTLPGGQSFDVDIPSWEKLQRLPDDMPLIQKVAIAYGFRNEAKNVKLMSYDFETITRGISPNPEEDRALSLAFYDASSAGAFTGTPEEVLKFFIKVVKDRDPDILAGFFSNRYDMLIAMAEAERSGISLDIGRDGSEPKIIFRRFDNSEEGGERFKVKTVIIDGRLHFDVFDEVIYDQSLIGIKGHGLKDVGKYLKIPNIIETDRSGVSKLKVSELLNYNLSDARLTYILAWTYLMNLIQLAEMMDLPMNLVMERTPSHIPNYIYGREFLERDEPYSGDNQTRFPQIFGGKAKCYQGAYVNIFKVGMFKPTKKLDFVNLYPSIMAALNLDPWTVELVEMLPYTGKKPRFESNEVTVSDKVIDADLRIRIDISKDSVTRRKLIEFIKLKAVLKPKIRTDPLVNSQYWVVKLILNATYGYHGLRYAKWGNVLISIITCAVGRAFLETICEKEKEKIEADTDGVYISRDISEEDIHNYEGIVRDLLPEWALKEYIQLDMDEYLGGLFVDEKNYVLKTTKNDFIFHGAGLKGKHLPIVVDRVLQSLMSALFMENCTARDWGAILRSAASLSDDIKDFEMKAQFNKTGYVGNSLYAQLEKKLADHDMRANVGDTVRYVKTITGYNLSEISARKQIDELYYLRRIADVCARALGPICKMKRKEILKIIKGETQK